VHPSAGGTGCASSTGQGNPAAGCLGAVTGFHGPLRRSLLLGAIEQRGRRVFRAKNPMPEPGREVASPRTPVTGRDTMLVRGEGGNKITQVAFLAKFSPAFGAGEQFPKTNIMEERPDEPAR